MRRFYSWLIKRVSKRAPDFVVGGHENPYLLRWWVIPRNRFFNVYLHLFLRDDDDRALHDHPWANCSVLLRGSYTEHTIAAGGIHRREVLKPGAVRFRWSGKFAHRVELHDGSCWTLFITGPVYRHWGFHCPEKGWVHWKEFTAAEDPGSVGAGCD
ncbi:hypothetical protein F3N42_03740 [Marinihelvus fidelis]|uniref:Cupin domain-containing protein n=1 Tax=Marinihelvus fidelis TaxID=2613842 RepID=A0A5N0TG61_9GAMM|nr:hypothetical protein [Marinihelvus fidelis]KAA9133474.1 hypothetical protein F3N42_03740 [Marinihelvus fidelis]